MDILLVEDDERVSHFLLRGLKAEGFSVAHAKDGHAGKERAVTGYFDVILLDSMLPGMDGRQLCKDLRASRISSPIMMLTALNASEDKIAALRSGADDYLTKPFDFDELVARIEALSRRGKSYEINKPQQVRIGNMTLDHEEMRVKLDGTPIELTAKEYQLLDLFVSSPRKVLSRTRILNKVWGYDSDPLTNVVDVYIRRLRAKLGWDSNQGWIKTIRNYGYRLDPPDMREPFSRTAPDCL